MMDMNVGVYQVEKNEEGEHVLDPVAILDTGYRGLTC